MNIHQAINQKSFRSNIEMALVNLFYTHNWYRDKYDHLYKAHGIRQQHYNVLRILKGKYPTACSPSEIKEVMLDKAPDLTRLIDKLVAMELVDRNLCPVNRRKMDILITKKGEELLKRITLGQDDLNKEISANFTDYDAQALSDLLDKLRT